MTEIKHIQTRAKTCLKEGVQGGARFVVGKNILAEYIDGVIKRVKQIGIKRFNFSENIMTTGSI